MAREQVLRAVKDAEAKAAERKAEAESEAVSIVAEARADASALVADGRAETDSETAKMIESARAAAAKEAAKVEKAGIKGLEAIREGGEARRGDAVEAVLVAFRE